MIHTRTMTIPEEKVQVNAWLDKHGKPVLRHQEFPKVNLIAFVEGEKDFEDIAFISLIQTDANIAFLENLTSNPYWKGSKRVLNEAIDRMILQLLEYCEQKSIKKVYALTEVPSVIKKAKKKFKFGHVSFNTQFLGREL